MINLRINCKSSDAADKLNYRINEALVGTPAFVNNEIIVSGVSPSVAQFEILIGINNNGRDLNLNALYDVDGSLIIKKVDLE